MIRHPKDTKDDPFLSRWSRRKQADQADIESPPLDEKPEQPPLPLNTVIPAASTGKMSTRVEADRLLEQSPEQSDVDALTDEDMPSLETLDEKSDFSGFMSPGVSEGLRKMALRKLFAGAGFNITDGLDDYDEDFTKFEPLGDLITSDMKHRQEVEEKKRLEKEEAERLAAEQAEQVESEDDSTPELTGETEQQESVEQNTSEQLAESAGQDQETDEKLDRGSDDVNDLEQKPTNT